MVMKQRSMWRQFLARNLGGNLGVVLTVNDDDDRSDSVA